MATSVGARSAVDKVTKSISGTNCTVEVYADREGDIDWNCVGEMGIKHVTEETASVAALVDFKFGQGSKSPTHRSRKSQTPTEWRFVHEKHDIMVFKKPVRSSSTIFMGRGVINSPLRTVAEFLKNVDNNFTWDNLLVEARYVRTLSESESQADYIGYQRFESTKCFLQTNRDMLYYVRCLYKDGNYIQAGVSVDDPEYVIPASLKRIEIRLGTGWYLEPYNGSSSKTLVTYIGDTDLKGIPNFMMNQVLKRHPLALRYIRYQLTERPQIESQSDPELELTIRSSRYQPVDHDESADSSKRYQDNLPVNHFLTRASEKQQ
ncbi:uncharacterized protein LOC135348997 [Halichondria panicea]|uniref:uncharacterized protein LOC135348997 n=1 Tax=Halichondria panicea TaxID=6063 RepID=UPI00312BBF6B